MATTTNDALELMGGDYTYTLAGVLGDKRSTMLESELQLNVPVTGRSRERGYTCYPGKDFTYGLQPYRSSHTVALALQGWPDLPVCALYVKKRELERDFMSLNRGAIDLGMTTTRDYRAYRNMYDKRMAPPEDPSLRRAPLVFPPGMTFGVPTRPSTPMFELLEHRYQKCWVQDRLAKYLKHYAAAERKGCRTEKKKPCASYPDTYTSRVRKYREPVDPAPLWHMPRFSKYAEPHLDTFASEKARQAAFKSAQLDCVPRRGRFATYKQGIREPAQT